MWSFVDLVLLSIGCVCLFHQIACLNDTNTTSLESTVPLQTKSISGSSSRSAVVTLSTRKEGVKGNPPPEESEPLSLEYIVAIGGVIGFVLILIGAMFFGLIIVNFQKKIQIIEARQQSSDSGNVNGALDSVHTQGEASNAQGIYNMSAIDNNNEQPVHTQGEAGNIQGNMSAIDNNNAQPVHTQGEAGNIQGNMSAIDNNNAQAAAVSDVKNVVNDQTDNNQTTSQTALHNGNDSNIQGKIQ